MEHIKFTQRPADYDALVHEGVPEYGDLTVAYKAGGMVSGRGVVCIAFTADIDGKPVKVQAVTSAAAFLMVAGCVQGAEQRSIDAEPPQGHE
jgi:hypothetical protein